MQQSSVRQFQILGNHWMPIDPVSLQSQIEAVPLRLQAAIQHGLPEDDESRHKWLQVFEMGWYVTYTNF